MNSLQGKTALITGAAQGNGLGIARVFAQKGATVIMTDQDDKVFGSCELIKYETKAPGVFAYLMDVSNKKQVADVISRYEEEIGTTDILVNNAGIGDKQMSITRCSDDWWRQIIAVNQDSVFYMSRAALVYMEKQGEGSIVNISSIGGVFANAGIAYSAAKAAVVAMTKNVAIQFAGKGIRCNAVCPGPTITPLLSSDEIATFDQEFMKTCNEHICRSVPKAEAVDQANAILYFASDLSKAVTGQALVVDYGCNL